MTEFDKNIDSALNNSAEAADEFVLRKPGGGLSPALTRAASSPMTLRRNIISSDASHPSFGSSPTGGHHRPIGPSLSADLNASLRYWPPVNMSAEQAEARHSVLNEIKALQLKRQSSFKRILKLPMWGSSSGNCFILALTTIVWMPTTEDIKKGLPCQIPFFH